MALTIYRHLSRDIPYGRDGRASEKRLHAHRLVDKVLSQVDDL